MKSALLSITAVAMTTAAVGNIQESSAVEPPNQSWYVLTIGEYGEPRFAQSPDRDRVQRQVLRDLRGYDTAQVIDEIERELNGALSGVEQEGGYGVNSGGARGFNFRLDGQVVVWFEYDPEAEGDDRYPIPARELVMPMAEFEPLFRDWAASVRHWRALGGENSVPLPADKRPKSYPPKQGS